MEISISEIESVVNVFYNSTNAVERSNAHSWLLKLQSSSVAWEICWLLMEPTKSIEVQYFGSSMLATKIQRSFCDIPTESVIQLKSKISNCVMTLKGNNLLVSKLLTALSCVILHELSSKDCQTLATYLELANRELSVDQGHNGLMVKLIKTLPETFNSVSLPGGQKSSIRLKLGDYYAKMVEFVRNAITSSSNIESVELILKCYLSWVEFGLPLSESHELLDSLFSMISHVQLSEYGVSVLIELITHPSSDRMHNSVYIFFKYLSRLEPLLKQALDNEDHDLANHICKLLVNSGESHIRLILTADGNDIQNDMLKVIQCILQCTSAKGNYPVDESISELTLNFWFLLQDDMMSIEKSEHMEYLNIIKNAYFHLLTILLHKVEYPSDDKLLSFTDDDKELFRCYRQDIQDTVMCIGSLLRDQCLKYFVETLEHCIQGKIGSWQKYEAILFLLQGVAEYVEFTEDVYIPRVMMLLFNLPPHQKIIERAVYLVGSYSEWLLNNTSYTDKVVPILLSGIENDDNCLSCSIALKDVCCECASTFNHSLSIKIIDTCLGALSKSSIKEKTKVRLFEIVGYTMSPLDLNVIKDRLPSVTLPVLQSLSSELQTNNLNEISKKQIIFCLNCLHGFLRTFDSILEPLPVQHPLIELVQMFFDIIVKQNPWTGIMDIAEGISPVIAKSLDVLQEQFLNLIPSCTIALLQLLEVSNCPLLFAPSATLIGMFGKHETVVSHIQRFFSNLLKLSITVLQNRSYDNNIEYLEHFMNFSARILKTSQNYFLAYPDALATVLSHAIAFLNCAEMATVKSTCSMTLALINTSCSDKLFLSIIEAHGLSLVEKILFCISGQSPRQLLDQYADLLFAMNKQIGQLLLVWLKTYLSNDAFLNGIATSGQKHHFQVAVLKEKSNKRRLREVVKEFALQCRGLQGTDYAKRSTFSY